MIEIPLSRIKALPFDFVQAVQDHIAAKSAHALTIGEPAPIAAHPLVEAAVVRYPPPPDQTPGDGEPTEHFVAEYTVIDDTPPPAAKKQALAALVGQMATEARERAFPQLLQRSMGNVANVANMVAEAERTPEQRDAIARYAEANARAQNVDRHLGELEAQIYHLADDQIDNWKPAEFP